MAFGNEILSYPQTVKGGKHKTRRVFPHGPTTARDGGGEHSTKGQGEFLAVLAGCREGHTSKATADNFALFVYPPSISGPASRPDNIRVSHPLRGGVVCTGHEEKAHRSR